MKYRIALWASAGFLVALGWALIALATHPASTEGLVWTLASITCPIAFARYLPISIYTVLAANAATYALAGAIVETVRKKYHQAT